MIEKIMLQNWKSHGQSEFSFTPGTNIIVGPMGAGKSSVLQAISFALFGTFSELKKKEMKISDIVRRGAGELQASISLELKTSKNGAIEIRRVIEDGNTKEASVREKDGRLLAGTNPAQVNAYLRDILKIDEDVFLRTVYAKQNEADIFLSLAPNERKTRLDELMCIDKFETARKGCVRLCNQLAERKMAHEGLARDFNIEKIESEIKNLASECENLETERANLKLKAAEIEKERGKHESEIKVLRKVFDECNRLEEKKGMLERQLYELEEKLKSISVEETLATIGLRIEEVKTKIHELQKSKFAMREDLDACREKQIETEKSTTILEREHAEVSKELAELDALKKELRGLERSGTFEFIDGKLKAAEIELKLSSELRSETVGELSVLKKHLAELESAQGACPVCSAELASSKKSELVGQRKSKISELESTCAKLLEKIEALEKEAGLLRSNCEQQKDITDKISKADGLQAKEREMVLSLSQSNGKRETLLGIIAQMKQRLDSVDSEISEFDSELIKLADKKHICESKEKKGEIETEISKTSGELAEKKISPQEIEGAEGRYRQAIKSIQEFESKASSNEYVIEEKKKRLANLEENKNRFFEIKKEIGSLDSKIEFLNQFKNALLVAQDSLRKELIAAVNEVMTDIWAQMYPYEKWSGLRLDASEEDYVLQIRENSGAWIPVAGFASGGERMIASLALRLAFAKVLAQNMNILILDEPTHNLDARAISTLVEVIQNKLSGFLDQLFIVTHDEKLAEAGDNIIRMGQ